ncbi:MAG: hypothetical protein HOP02_06805 [Methylococcaceae bacterium]|nr:hypothetical protein [Methylococcaceae bacterium]
MYPNNETIAVPQKLGKQTRFLSYGKEITFALLVKFLLLGGLWWLFFAGHKQPVDGAMLAKQLFGDPIPAITAKPNQEH